MKRVSTVLMFGLLAFTLLCGQAYAVPLTTEELIQRVTERLENRIDRQFERIGEIYQRNPDRAERRWDRFLGRIERRIERIENRRSIDIPIDLPTGTTYASFVSLQEPPSSGSAAPVPEPGTIFMMMAGLGGLGFISRKKILK